MGNDFANYFCANNKILFYLRPSTLLILIIKYFNDSDRLALCRWKHSLAKSFLRNLIRKSEVRHCNLRWNDWNWARKYFSYFVSFIIEWLLSASFIRVLLLSRGENKNTKWIIVAQNCECVALSGSQSPCGFALAKFELSFYRRKAYFKAWWICIRWRMTMRIDENKRNFLSLILCVSF